MSLAWLSLAALAIVILVSCFSRLNAGLLAIAMAWILGVYFGGMRPDDVMRGFPISLFVTLAGVTILFAQAQDNGTLDRIARRAVSLCRGNTGLIPLAFFLFAAALASLGPGNIATAALLAPMAMAAAGRAGIPAFLMAILVGNGANAGSLSPFAPTGIVVAGLMNRIGLPGMEWSAYWVNFAAHAVVALAGFAIFGGLALLRRRHEEPAAGRESLETRHWITIVVVGSLVLGVVFLNANVGLGAFAAVVSLGLLRAADPDVAIRKAPWNVILMVGGVTVLISLLEKTGGLDLFAGLLATVATRDTVAGVVAFVTGLVSTYSSTSSVVLPAFLPTVPGLAERLHADPREIALAMTVGSHLVDVSPLSTIGALCIASATPGEDTRALFNKLLAWGLSMTVVSGLLCWLAARWV